MSDSSAVAMNALCGALAGLTVIITGLRFYARFRQKASLLTDDWLMVPALITFLGCVGMLFYSVHVQSLGYSSFEVPPTVARFVPTKKMTVVLDVLTVVSLACIKSSALFFYRRIFCVNYRKGTFNIIILTTVGLIAAWTVTFCFLSGFQCQTHLEESFSNPKIQAQYCMLQFPVFYSMAITDLIFDIWVLILPIPSIIKLKTTKTRKFSILGVFLLACGGLAAAIARAVIFAQIYYGGPAALMHNDNEKQSTKIQFYMVLEAGLAFVAVNLPSVWLIFATVTPERVLRSIRSAISLASIRSRGSKDSQGSGGRSKAAAGAMPTKSSSSLSSTAPFGEPAGDAYCMHNVSQHSVPPIPTGQILVQHSHTLSTEAKKQDV